MTPVHHPIIYAELYLPYRNFLYLLRVFFIYYFPLGLYKIIVLWVFIIIRTLVDLIFVTSTFFHSFWYFNVRIFFPAFDIFLYFSYLFASVAQIYSYISAYISEALFYITAGWSLGLPWVFFGLDLILTLITWLIGVIIPKSLLPLFWPCFFEVDSWWYGLRVNTAIIGLTYIDITLQFPKELLMKHEDMTSFNYLFNNFFYLKRLAIDYFIQSSHGYEFLPYLELACPSEREPEYEERETDWWTMYYGWLIKVRVYPSLAYIGLFRELKEELWFKDRPPKRTVATDSLYNVDRTVFISL